MSSMKPDRALTRIVHAVMELGLAGAFLGAVFFADRVGARDVSATVRFLAALTPVAVLGVWLGYYVWRLRALDELQRSIEYRSLALAGWAAVLIATGSGIMTLFADAPALAPVFVAPIAAAIYAVIRAVMFWRYK